MAAVSRSPRREAPAAATAEAPAAAPPLSPARQRLVEVHAWVARAKAAWEGAPGNGLSSTTTAMEIGEAEGELRRAIADVLRTSGRIEAIIAGVQIARRRLALLEAILTEIGVTPPPGAGDAGKPVPAEFSHQLGAWASVVEALRTDPNAPLPGEY